jgi:hypothetical protein
MPETSKSDFLLITELFGPLGKINQKIVAWKHDECCASGTI